MEDVLVLGGGIGGLTTALAMARAGHPVTVLERDVTPPVASPAEAFAFERRGAPQSHQTHGFLARVMVLLRDRFPDVLEDLLAQGCTTMTGVSALGDPQPGDEDLKVLIVRRTTFEWVLRRAAAAEPGVRLRTGVGVAGLTGSTSDHGVPVVDGAVTDTGELIPAGMVVAATGRRGVVPSWLAPLGVEIKEKVHESGLMYVSRWYHLPPDHSVAIDPKLGGDLGFVKYLAVPGDGATLSITLAIRADDRELREALRQPGRFEAACRALPGPDRFFERGPLEPIGDVRPMTGLLNRIRRFVDADGHPLVLGFHAVGDAHTCTNPLYGRGCSLAVHQAVSLADAAAAHPGDARGRAEDYEASNRRTVEPWWRVSVQMDRAGADVTSGLATSDAGKGIAAVFVAGATDPVIGRGMARFFNLLSTPEELMADQEFMSRVMDVASRPHDFPVPAYDGPTRADLLEMV
jgi:2-polyprenyl-6-methoxyphenol hydroxylase-like FAD-dependent oxidoreductase